MPPVTSRDFQKAAGQRLTTAEHLRIHKSDLDAQYIGGYAVECTLKALILHRTREDHREETRMKITSGASMHKPEVLLGELRRLGVVLPLELVKRLRRSNWTVDLRYETGRRDTGEMNALLKTAKAIMDWGGGPAAMTDPSPKPWKGMRGPETREVEKTLINAGFEQVDAYRFNSASIRVRVIDPRFEGLSDEQRDPLVEPYLEKLPERIQADIMSLFTFAPSEIEEKAGTFHALFMNLEFEKPSPSML